MLGWTIYGSGNSWCAYRFGVRLSANSKELLIKMIKLRPSLSTLLGR